MDRQNICEKCVWWENKNKRNQSGNCRRFPPVFPLNEKEARLNCDDPATGVWPMTKNMDWCGEFKIDESKRVPLSESSLSVRAKNSLSHGGIIFFDQLASLTTEELFSIRHAGKKTINEIIQFMKESGSDI